MDIKSYIEYIDFDVHIYYVDMPFSITSNVVENTDGSYTIYINSRLSYEKQQEGYLHELKHISNNDLYECTNVQKVEKGARL